MTYATWPKWSQRKESSSHIGIQITRIDEALFRLEYWRGISYYHFELFVKRGTEWVKLYQHKIPTWDPILPEIARIKAMVPTYRVLEVL